MSFPVVGAADDGGDEVVQVTMTSTFYNAHFVPLIRRLGLRLVEAPVDADELRTIGIGV